MPNPPFARLVNAKSGYIAKRISEKKALRKLVVRTCTTCGVRRSRNEAEGGAALSSVMGLDTCRSVPSFELLLRQNLGRHGLERVLKLVRLLNNLLLLDTYLAHSKLAKANSDKAKCPAN